MAHRGPEPEPAHEEMPAQQPAASETKRVAKRSRADEPERNIITSELEPIGDDVQRRRDMDNTLARFSAVHDELIAEERRRRSKRSRYLPWVNEVDELDEALTFSNHHGETEYPADAAEDDKPREAAERSSSTRLREKKQRRNERGVVAGKITAGAVSALVLLTSGIGWGTSGDESSAKASGPISSSGLHH